MIDILLATYNGEKYLNQQIDSILSQTEQNWQLLVRDDGSTDNTLKIINSYIEKYPDRITLIKDSKGNLGPANNFQALLKLSEARYTMFCDQDDVWLPNKIELTLTAMQDAEQKYPDMPILVHTDLTVTDENIRLAGSFWKRLKISDDKDFNLEKLIYRNTITGCTMMLNNKARDIVLPFPPQVRLHDWWIALNIAKVGKIISLPVQTIFYRQHSKNVIGIRKPKTFPQRLREGIKNIYSDYRIAKRVSHSANLITLLLTNARLFITRRLN